MIGFAGRGSNTLNSYPPKSNDLNPVENLIHIFKKRVWHYAPKTMDQLHKAIFKAWEDIEINDYAGMIRSMNKRLGRVIELAGEKTKY